MRGALVITLALLLSACGFRPLYEAGGSSRAMQQHLAGVEVAPIADRLGQVMRNRLLDRLNTGGTADYRLTVTLEQSTQGYGIRPDAAATQEQLTLVAHVAFIRLNGEEIVFTEDMRARTSYDLVLSDFATVTQREDSARRLALELAERIHRRLALYFTKAETDVP
ncbi:MULTISPECIES: LPS assembly lipoprotein LptE [Kordiimonas]|jgi:LPS-assembly lipoprotein|uniref:LPS assembly lipoprotein LptE n=1 Tax=Kordiimonas TaxID=288021 RepID=UPI00257D5541|nr:LPS assembly lipoprotein LptE [Kordiimonas sp. UBA4487]